MKYVSAPSVSCKIWIAGDLEAIKAACSEFCMSGLCVSVTPTEFIFTMGRETGACVGLINYPRFPSSERELVATATQLANFLLERLFQGSCTVEGPSQTTWITRREQDK